MRAIVASAVAGLMFSIGYVGPSIASPAQSAIQSQASGYSAPVHKAFWGCNRADRSARVVEPRVYGYTERAYRPRVYGYTARRNWNNRRYWNGDNRRWRDGRRDSWK
ncbi:hypothetical protein SAMN04488061_1699 [Filomicrobium insigne]|uniref:Uncharacterized protein n=1 Tax=Filomicrobium insigne TaxID=418854 RepID=A0A1H0MIK0_9HYPH|nr:hypothetical protein SAMN04488061_1699 [Filomicrobium insigne]